MSMSRCSVTHGKVQTDLGQLLDFACNTGFSQVTNGREIVTDEESRQPTRSGCHCISLKKRLRDVINLELVQSPMILIV